MNTVGLVLMNEDVLQGKKFDVVSQFLIEKLNLLEYTVKKVTVIPDHEGAIVHELDSLIKSVDIIIVTSERHCRTLKAIGKVISQELRESDDLVEFFNRTSSPYDKEEVFLPVQTKLIKADDAYPVIHFQRIFLLQEQYFKESFTRILKNHLIHYKAPRRYQKTIEIYKNGNAVTDLNEINGLKSKNTTIEFSENRQHFVLKISSLDLGSMAEFIENMKKKFESYRLKFIDDAKIWENVYTSCENHIQNSIENIGFCIDEYGIDNIFVCFNGGKDCTVLLHLVLAVIHKKYPNSTQSILCLYVQSEKPFTEQEEFINKVKSYYNLKIITIRSGIKDALQQTLEKFPNYKACLMGTRRTDPYSANLNEFQMTDLNWPQIMRVSPILDWHYSDVWDYLLYFKVPYCSLYDMGYTSLGNTVDTAKNPSLIYYDYFEGKKMYLPAHKLWKEVRERNGRDGS